MITHGVLKGLDRIAEFSDHALERFTHQLTPRNITEFIGSIALVSGAVDITNRRFFRGGVLLVTGFLYANNQAGMGTEHLPTVDAIQPNSNHLLDDIAG